MEKKYLQINGSDQASNMAVDMHGWAMNILHNSQGQLIPVVYTSEDVPCRHS